MRLVPSSDRREPRRRTLRVAIAAGVFVLFALGAAGPAWAAGAKSPHRLIFDPAAEPSWLREFHSAGAFNEGAEAVVMAPGGVTYVAGTMLGPSGNQDASLMKLVDGDPAWPSPKLYDGPNHGGDSADAIALGPGGTVYTAGSATGSNGMPDLCVVKWSSSGAVLWAKRYDGPDHSMEAAESVVVDSAGNVTVGGMTVVVGGMDWVVVSWSSSGARRWVSRYTADGPHQVVPMSLVVAGDRSVYACGISAGPPDVASMVVKYSPSGKTLWKKVYRGPAGLGAYSFSAVARPGGGVYVGGSALSAATGTDGLVMGYTAKGARDVFALATGPGGASEQRFADIALTSTKQVVAVGSNTGGVSQDCYAVTYTADGTIAGQVTLPGAWNDEFVAVATDGFGGFYATGTYHTLVNKTAIVTARGSVLTGGGGFIGLWAPAFISADNEPRDIAVRGSTACVVGWCNEGVLHGMDQFVLGFVY